MTNSDQACLLISLVSGSPSNTDNVICLSPLSAFNSSHYRDICHCPHSREKKPHQYIFTCISWSCIHTFWLYIIFPFIYALLLLSCSWWWLLKCEKAQIIDISSLFVENNRAPDSIMMGGGEGVIITLPAHYPHCPLMMTLNSQHYTVEGGADAAVIWMRWHSLLFLSGHLQADCELAGNRRSVPWQPWQVFADTLTLSQQPRGKHYNTLSGLNSLNQ